MLLLAEEFMIAVSEYVVNHYSNAEQLHRHVKCSKDFLACIFIIQVSLNLSNLNKQQLFMICVKNHRVHMTKYIPIYQMTDKSY